MEGSNVSVWPLVVLMSVLLKNGDAFTIVQHKYSFTKMDVRLDCPFLEGPSIVWKETGVGEINGTNAKYNNFDVSSERNISTLTIKRAEMEDEGIYSCHSLTGNSISFQLHMQNPPILSISVNGIVVNTSIDLNENTEVTVECNATGADPPVYVSLAVDDEPLILDEQIMNNYTQTAYASSRLTVEQTHREIVCIDSEQKLAMYKKTIYLNVNYKGLSDGAIFALAIGVVVVLLVGSIGLCIFKRKELSGYARVAIAIGVVSLIGLMWVIIFKHMELPFFATFCAVFGVSLVVSCTGCIGCFSDTDTKLQVYAMVVVAIGAVVILVPSIGWFIVAAKKFSVESTAAYDIAVFVALSLPIAFAVVVLLVGLIRWIIHKRRRANTRKPRFQRVELHLK